MARSRPEEHMLSILRTEPRKVGIDGVGEMSDTDWEALLHTSARHGVSPLLYHRLTTFHKDSAVPTEVLRVLHRSYLQNSGRNMYLYHELGRVLEKLQQDDIAVIALKGAHLAEVIYGNAALRPMNDVDLLVHREDLERVEKKMLESGYVPEDCNRLIADDNYHFGYSLPNGGLTVEIHWNFLPANLSFGIDMDGQWRRSRTTFLGGAEVSVLCPEDLLLHQCLHASKHLYDIWLKPFCDIFETIRHYGDAIDWDQVRIRSREAGISNCVYLTLVLARELLGAAVPDTLLVTIKPEDFDERFIAMARGRIFDTDKRSADSVSLPPNAFQIIGTSRFMNKAGQFLKRVCPSRAEMTRMYPAASGSLWIFLYYPVRIRTLLLRYGCLGCQLLLRNEEVLVLTKREKDITPLRKWLISAARATEDHAEPQRFPER